MQLKRDEAITSSLKLLSKPGILAVKKSSIF
jgi:hypothetical protein